MALNERVKEARAAARFVQIITRDAQGRAKTLYVPGHDGRKYQVILRHIQVDGRNVLTAECRMDARQLGYKPCQGNGRTVCYHAMAAVIASAQDGGYKVAFSEDPNVAVRLSHMGGTANELMAHNGTGRVYMRIYKDIKLGLRGAKLRRIGRERMEESDDFNRKWAEFKDEFAKREAEQEREAFMSDPDMRKEEV